MEEAIWDTPPALVKRAKTNFLWPNIREDGVHLKGPTNQDPCSSYMSSWKFLFSFYGFPLFLLYSVSRSNSIAIANDQVNYVFRRNIILENIYYSKIMVFLCPLISKTKQRYLPRNTRFFLSCMNYVQV